MKSYHPTPIALAEYTARLARYGVQATPMKSYEVIDHLGGKALVYSPHEVRRKQATNSSMAASKWMDHLSIKYGTVIWHQGNGLEVRIRGCSPEGKEVWLEVDGYSPEALTVYEYNGDHFHPNPLLHPLDSMWTPATAGTAATARTPRKAGTAGQTSGSKYDHQEWKRTVLAMMGYRYVSVTEYEWGRYEKEAASVAKRILSGKAKNVPDIFLGCLPPAGDPPLSSFLPPAQSVPLPSFAPSPAAAAAAAPSQELSPYRAMQKMASGLSDSARPHYNQLLAEGDWSRSIYAVSRELPSHYRSLSLAVNFTCLSDISRGSSAHESLGRLARHMSADTIMPFSFVDTTGVKHRGTSPPSSPSSIPALASASGKGTPTKEAAGGKRMRYGDYAAVLAIAVNLIDAFFPGFRSQKWSTAAATTMASSGPMTALPRLTDDIKASRFGELLRVITVENRELLRVQFNKKEAGMSETTVWDFSYGLRFTNAIIGRVFGVQIEKVSTKAYGLVLRAPFGWTGTSYAPLPQ